MTAKFGLSFNEEERNRLLLKIEKLRKRLLKDEPMTYEQSVVKIYKDYEELVFNLSEASKNETIASIKAMTVGQRMEFENLLIKRINRQNSKIKNG